MPETSFSTHGGAGDILCLLSVVRTLARIEGEPQWVTHFEDVVQCYGDDLLGFGRKAEHRHIDICGWHRRKHESEHVNYLGTFAKAVMPDVDLPVDFDFPTFESSEKKCLLQVRSNFAANPDQSFVQSLVDEFTARTGETLYVIGDENTPRYLERVDYSLIRTSIPHLLENISNARCVLTPRSISAHAAAGYKIPTLVWLPDDGENWHLDYPNWTHFRIGLNSSQDERSAALEALSLVLLPAKGSESRSTRGANEARELRSDKRLPELVSKVATQATTEFIQNHGFTFRVRKSRRGMWT